MGIRDMMLAKGAYIVSAFYGKPSQRNRENFAIGLVTLYGEAKIASAKMRQVIKMDTVRKGNCLGLAYNIRNGERQFSEGIIIPAKFAVITEGAI